MKRWIERAQEPEEHDDTPVEIPAALKQPETMQEMLARLIAERVAGQAQAQGFDTWEEDEDFEDEDPNLLDMTKYEFQELEGEDTFFREQPSETPTNAATGDEGEPELEDAQASEQDS